MLPRARDPSRERSAWYVSEGFPVAAISKGSLGLENRFAVGQITQNRPVIRLVLDKLAAAPGRRGIK